MAVFFVFLQRGGGLVRENFGTPQNMDNQLRGGKNSIRRSLPHAGAHLRAFNRWTSHFIDDAYMMIV